MKNSIFIILLVGLSSCLNGHDSIQDPPVGFGSEEPSLLATENGLILSWIEPIDGDIHLRFSNYNGIIWSQPKTIAKGANWFVNWADFPAVISNGDMLFAHFLQISGQSTYDYDIMYTFSKDQGKNWSTPQMLHSDSVSAEHGFVSGIPYKDGFAVSWLDGRFTKGENPRMTLRGAIINSQGVIANDYELDSMTCDCCHTAVALANDKPVVFYRDRSSEEVRDIRMAGFSEIGVVESTALHEDDWQINACPVNGPAVGNDGNTLAVVWYSGKEGVHEVKLKISHDGGANFGEPILVDGPETFGRVDVQLHNEKILVTYLTRRDESGSIVLATYDYNGNLESKLPLVSTSFDRRTGFPRSAVWNEKLHITWTEVEESKVKVLSVPLSPEQIRAGY